MKNFLPKHLRKPVPKFSGPWLEAARRQVQLNRSEDPETHSSKVPPPRSDDRSTYAGNPDPTP
jgi:hypothetical protein